MTPVSYSRGLFTRDMRDDAFGERRIQRRQIPVQRRPRIEIDPPPLALRQPALDAAFTERIIAHISGEETAAERNDEREIAIWKRGVTL